MNHFKQLAPLLYFANNNHAKDDAAHRLFIEEYSTLLQQSEPFVMIVDSHEQPDAESAKAMALFFKEYKAKMAEKIIAMIYIAHGSDEMAQYQKRAEKTAKAFPYPIHIASNLEQAKNLG